MAGRQKKTLHNSTYPKREGLYSKESFVVNLTLVFQIKFCSEKPALRLVENLTKSM